MVLLLLIKVKRQIFSNNILDIIYWYNISIYNSIFAINTNFKTQAQMNNKKLHSQTIQN